MILPRIFKSAYRNLPGQISTATSVISKAQSLIISALAIIEMSLTRARLLAYARLTLITFLVTGLAWVWLSHNRVDISGNPLGGDFSVFWAAAKLAEAGNATEAYDTSRLNEVQRLAIPNVEARYGWFYPPNFLLILWPLSKLDYPAAFWTFMLATAGAYFFILHRAAEGIPILFLMAFPGFFVNLIQGQNGFLTAALAGLSILLMERRPRLAGILIGLMIIKPHLAVLFPISLIASRSWKTLGIAAITAVGFTVLSSHVLGWETFKTFMDNLHIARTLIEEGGLIQNKMPSVFVTLRRAGLPINLAWLAHGLLGALVALTVFRTWKTSAPLPLKGAMLMTASLLTTPYLYDYDLAWLAFPILWVIKSGCQSGWLPMERITCFLAWYLPILVLPLAKLTEWPVAPFLIGLLLWISIRRCIMAGQATEKTRVSHAGNHHQSSDIV